MRTLTFIGLVAALTVTTAVVRDTDGSTRQAAAQSASRRRAPDTATEAEARAACGGACHKFAPPDILPQAAWRDELVRMMLIQDGVPEPAGATNQIPLPPEWLPVLRFYESGAPEVLPTPEPWPPVSAAPPALEKHAITPASRDNTPAIANIRFLDVRGDGTLEIIASDMRSGDVLMIDPKPPHNVKTLATLRNPAHIEMVDLDQDGRQDLLVADLGSFQPADHENGALHWLRQEKDGTFTTTTLTEGLGRVADARAADFDQDGDLDIVAAVFGWRQTGGIVLLENQTRNWESPRFVARTLDSRTGAIHVPIADLNKDGRPDFVALFAQEHESVVAFLSSGKRLTFEKEIIYAAPHPNWGSSGIELVDLDKDGDLDVLLTHGDTFDDSILKPYHGIMWLENRGGYPFRSHQLATLPGAHRAQAVDLDGDDDLDVVACAMVGGSGDVELKLASLVWLEQVRPGVFTRHTLEMGTPYHATLDVADYDGDGDEDLVVGWFALVEAVTGWADVWENLTASRPAVSPGPRR
ncbi:MAG: VCBS repeat-containing protein [Luteitalea sp.]|nr:VCBS repeat-containing protein [Luteitalea sp.]